MNYLEINQNTLMKCIWLVAVNNGKQSNSGIFVLFHCAVPELLFQSYPSFDCVWSLRKSFHAVILFIHEWRIGEMLKGVLLF